MKVLIGNQFVVLPIEPVISVSGVWEWIVTAEVIASLGILKIKVTISYEKS